MWCMFRERKLEVKTKFKKLELTAVAGSETGRSGTGLHSASM